MAKDNLARIGIAQSGLQMTRLREIATSIGMPKSRFMSACVAVLADDEITGIMSR